jgi:hypothetical protein
MALAGMHPQVQKALQSTTVEPGRLKALPYLVLGRMFDSGLAGFPCQEGFKMKAGFEPCR